MKKMLKTYAHKPEWQGVTDKSIDDMEFCETCARSKLTKQSLWTTDSSTENEANDMEV